MTHSHEHHHSHSHLHSHEAGRNIGIAFALNAVFVIIEVIGGLLTNSIAILTDALHDFGDCLSLGMAWFLQRKSQQPRDAGYSYGYKRFSLLGTVFLSGVLLVSSIFVIIEAVGRIVAPQDLSAQGMMWLAIVGIAVNGAAALRVSHGSSLNERAVYLHIMEDVLGWVAVLVVSIVMQFVHLPILDPLLSISISIWVLTNIYKNLRDTGKVFLQATPDGIDLELLTAELTAIEGIDSIHDLHLWSLDGESHVMTLHVVTSCTGMQAIKEEIAHVAKAHDITHVTTEIEPPGTHCVTGCD